MTKLNEVFVVKEAPGQAQVLKLNPVRLKILNSALEEARFKTENPQEKAEIERMIREIET